MSDKQTFNRTLYQRALLDSLLKLDPRRMVRNPVMFVVEVGSVLTTVLWVQALLGHGEAELYAHTPHIQYKLHESNRLLLQLQPALQHVRDQRLHIGQHRTA